MFPLHISGKMMYAPLLPSNTSSPEIIRHLYWKETQVNIQSMYSVSMPDPAGGSQQRPRQTAGGPRLSPPPPPPSQGSLPVPPSLAAANSRRQSEASVASSIKTATLEGSTVGGEAGRVSPQKDTTANPTSGADDEDERIYSNGSVTNTSHDTAAKRFEEQFANAADDAEAARILQDRLDEVD